MKITVVDVVFTIQLSVGLVRVNFVVLVQFKKSKFPQYHRHYLGCPGPCFCAVSPGLSYVRVRLEFSRRRVQDYGCF